MAAVQLPLEFIAMSKQVAATVDQIAAQVEALDEKVNQVNASFENLGAGAGTGLGQVTDELKRTNDELNQITENTGQAQLTLTQRFEIIASAVSEAIEVFQTFLSILKLLRRIILPLAIIFGSVGNSISFLFLDVQEEIIKLRFVIIFNLFLIKKAFNDLLNSKSLPEFIENIEIFALEAGSAFSTIIGQVKNVEDAFRNRFDPVTIAKNFAVIVTGIFTVIDAVGFLTIKLTGRNPLILLSDSLLSLANRVPILADRIQGFGISVAAFLQRIGSAKVPDFSIIFGRAAFSAIESFRRGISSTVGVILKLRDTTLSLPNFVTIFSKAAFAGFIAAENSIIGITNSLLKIGDLKIPKISSLFSAAAGRGVNKLAESLLFLGNTVERTQFLLAKSSVAFFVLFDEFSTILGRDFVRTGEVVSQIVKIIRIDLQSLITRLPILGKTFFILQNQILRFATSLDSLSKAFRSPINSILLTGRVTDSFFARLQIRNKIIQATSRSLDFLGRSFKFLGVNLKFFAGLGFETVFFKFNLVLADIAGATLKFIGRNNLLNKSVRGSIKVVQLFANALSPLRDFFLQNAFSARRLAVDLLKTNIEFIKLSGVTNKLIPPFIKLSNVLRRASLSFAQIAGNGENFIRVKFFQFLRPLQLELLRVSRALGQVQRALLGIPLAAKAFQESERLIRAFTAAGRAAAATFGFFADQVRKLQGPLRAASRFVLELVPQVSRITPALVSVSKTIRGFGTSVRVAGESSNFFFRILQGNNITRFGQQTAGVSSNLAKFGKEAVTVANQTELMQKSIFGTITRVRVLGIGLTFLGAKLKESENAFISFIGSATEFIGFVLDPLGILFTQILVKAGQFVKTFGTDIVTAVQTASANFQSAEASAFVFLRTITSFSEVVGSEAIPTTEAWTEQINALNLATGASGSSLRIAAAEISALGSEIGLTAEQQEFLLEASVDYNAFVKGDLVQTTLDLLSGLQGNSQSTQKFGLRLNEAALSAKLLAKGITSTTSQLSENEKVQTRLEIVTGKYAKVAGLAAAQTSTFEGTAKLAESRIEGFNVALGKGANVVENFAIGQRLLITAIDLVPESIIPVLGFFSALAGRALQVGGVILEFSFIIVLLTSGIKALNVAIASETFGKLWLARIPFLQKSLLQLAVSAGATTGAVTGIGTAFKVTGQIAVFQMKRIIATLLGLNAATLTTAAVFARLKVIAIASFKAITAFLAANPIIITLLGIGVALFVLFKAFQRIEEETKVFSILFNDLNQIFKEFVDSIDGASFGFDSLGDSMDTLVNQTLGLFISLIAASTGGLLLLASVTPGVGTKMARAFAKAGKSLLRLNNQLVAADFDIRQLGQSSELASKKVEQSFLSISIKLPKGLEKLRQELENIGLTDLQKVQAQQDARLLIIKEGEEQQLAIIKQSADAQFLLINSLVAKNTISATEGARRRAVVEKEELAGISEFNKRIEELNAQVREAAAIKSIEIEKKRIEELNKLGEEFGSRQSIRRRQQIQETQLLQAQELLTLEEFLAAQQQIAIEAETAMNEVKLLTEEEFQQRLQAIKINAAQSATDAAINNAFLVEGIQRDTSLRSLFFEKGILEKKLKQDNLSAEQRKLVERRLQAVREQIGKRQLNQAASVAGSLMTLAQGSSEGIFEIAKTAATAIAIVKGFQAVQNALADVPFPANILAAAAIGLQAAVQVKGIQSTNFQKGGLVPPGFPNDSLVSGLSSGERVLNVEQNRAFDKFIDNENSGRNDQRSQKSDELMGKMVELQRQTLTKLNELDGDINVQVGNTEIFRELRTGLREGRSLAV